MTDDPNRWGDVPKGDLDLLVALGRNMYGERWQARLADDAGIVPSQLHGIVRKTLNLSPAVRAKLAAFAEERARTEFERAIMRGDLLRAMAERFRSAEAEKDVA